MSFWSSLFGASDPELASQVRALVSKGARILDVRTPGEFASGHVDGALNIPVSELPARLAEVGSKDVPVILYCRSGARSAQAASLLRSSGFREVIDVGPMSAFPQ